MYATFSPDDCAMALPVATVANASAPIAARTKQRMDNSL
jgi:hypothetical protein